jgi:hypothetical protein
MCKEEEEEEEEEAKNEQKRTERYQITNELKLLCDDRPMGAAYYAILATKMALSFYHRVTARCLLMV